VDDHPKTADLLARALGDFNMPVEILTASGGQQALDIIGPGSVEVLITDFMMPGMSGLDLIETLVKDSRAPGHSILITAYDSPGLAETARRLRVNDYLVKPFQPDKIREIVHKALVKRNNTPPRPPMAEPARTPAAGAASSFRILVADDRPDNVHLLATRLSSEGYSFLTAGDGEETLQKLRADQPDLVLLDVDMPKKNGFEVIAEMRADASIAHIPVIVITAARITSRDIREGLSLGADDYVTKPFDWRELAARVRSKLRVKQVEDALRRRNRELGLLPEIGQDLSARFDIEELVTVTLKRSVEALRATNGHMVVFHPDGSTYHELHTPRDFSPLTWEEVQTRLVSEGMVAHVVATRQGALVEDTEQDDRWFRPPNDISRSSVCVPLLSRRGVIGALTLIHTQPAYFNSDHITLLQAIASQAAIAIENAQLYSVELRRVKELVALNQLTREINRFTRSAELFDQLPQLLHDTLSYPSVSMWVINPDTRTPLLRQVVGSDKAPRQSVLGLAPMQVAATGQPATVSGSVEERTGARAGTGMLPTHSAVAVPLLRKQKVSGVLAIHSQRPNAFQESERVVLENIAAQVTSALERIQLFESVEQEQERLAAVLRGAADAILVLDMAGELRLVNPAGQRLFTDVETKIGQPLPKASGYDELIALLERARQSKTSEQGEIMWPDKRTFAAIITPIEEWGQVAILHDVSHFKELARVKNEFIATASHDLKNPITTVMAYAELLEKVGPLNERQADFAERIRRASKQMHELVLNLLDLARADLGIELKLEPCELHEMLTGVAEEFQTQAASKQQTLIVDLPEELPMVKVDPSRLRQVVRNLVGNAIKYTPDGGRITISADATPQYLTTHISDTGYGISASALPFLFDKFYRVQNEATQDIEGNGLGLAIVKSIIEQHGGRVRVDSTLGQGSRFSFSLPLKSLPEPKATMLVD
jgi:signal transduction histidine kinase/DNA-binding response OmpR family regulator